MKVLLLFILLTNCLPQTVSQTYVRPSQTQKTGMQNLEDKIDRLGNELVKLGMKVDLLLEKTYDPELAPKAIWPPIKLERASREVLERGGCKYTVWFSTTNPMVAATPHWRLRPEGKTGLETISSTLNRFNRPDESTDFVTTVEVKEPGQLTLDLIEKDFRFEFLLLLDNSEKAREKSQFQRVIPMHNFAVDADDVVNYKEDERVHLKISASTDTDTLRVHVGADIQYLNPERRIGYYSCAPGEVDDIVCKTTLTKRYFSYYDMLLSINTDRVKPVGYTRVHSTYRDKSQLVQGSRLVRVLSIRPSDQANAYPPGFLDVVAVGGECSYTQDKCPAQCVVYGNSVSAQSIKIEKLRDNDKKMRIPSESLTYHTVLGYASATAYLDIPEHKRVVESDVFICSVKQKGQKKREDMAELKYRVKTQVSREKSFFEINESQVKITCSAMGDPRPQTMASLSLRPHERMGPIDLNYVSFKSLPIGPTEIVSVFTYVHNYGQIDLDRVKAVCYARGDPNDPSDTDEYELTESYYLTRDRM